MSDQEKDQPVEETPSLTTDERLTQLLEVMVENMSRAEKREVALHGDPAQMFEQLHNTTTAEIPGGEELDHEVVFRSRGINYGIIFKPRRQMVTASGERMFSDGIRFDFPKGEFRTKNKLVQEYIRSRPQFNADVWEVGNEPGRVPSPDLVLDRVAKAISELDDATLAEIETAERSTYKRPEVLTTIASGRRHIQSAAESVS